jgi:arylsulfatase A-like enzyme
VILADWAAYLDAVRLTDLQVGEVLHRLDAEGLRETTIIAFMTDHGISHARGKQFLHDEGIHVPLILAGPGLPRGEIRDELVSQIDLTATSLALAGIAVPDWMQGRDLLAKDHAPRDAVFSARDRCDETVDRIRSVRTDHYKYIRNFYPSRPLLQPNRYKDAKPIIARLRALHAAGGLDDLQERLLFSPTRPVEELYDLQADPHELVNLAADPARRNTMEALRARLERWMVETNDQGRTPESPSRYDSEMAVYLDSKAAAQDEILRSNIALMKRWAAEGK